MDIRQITPAYAVSPQIDPEDFATLARAGFTTIINNRPCSEIPPSQQVDAMQRAADAAGLKLVVLPATHATLTPDLAAQQKQVCEQSDGPVLAYCASGTRCTIIWAMMQAGNMDASVIIQTAADHGYDLRAMRGQLDALVGRQA
jgi:uncharacterized protein (TIGR01244 family)